MKIKKMDLMPFIKEWKPLLQGLKKHKVKNSGKKVMGRIIK